MITDSPNYLPAGAAARLLQISEQDLLTLVRAKQIHRCGSQSRPAFALRELERFHGGPFHPLDLDFALTTQQHKRENWRKRNARRNPGAAPTAALQL